MRDIPIFTTSAGAASLFLRRVPFTKDAYIKIQDSQAPERLLDECCDFCKAVGAERIYVSGLPREPHSSTICIYEMKMNVDALPKTGATLQPVQEETLEAWRSIYNEKMQGVFYATLIGAQEKAKLLKEGGCYFVYNGNKLLGIGKINEEEVQALATVLPGKGQDVLSALASVLKTKTVKVTVADTNSSAIKLYERLGFERTDLLSCWYPIL